MKIQNFNRPIAHFKDKNVYVAIYGSLSLTILLVKNKKITTKMISNFDFKNSYKIIFFQNKLYIFVHQLKNLFIFSEKIKLLNTVNIRKTDFTFNDFIIYKNKINFICTYYNSLFFYDFFDDEILHTFSLPHDIKYFKTSYLYKNKFFYIAECIDGYYIASIDIKISNIQVSQLISHERSNSNTLRNPCSIIVNKKFIYVSDTDNYYIKLFDHNFKFVSSFGGKGHFLSNFDLVVNLICYKNFIYLCDQNNDQIKKFNKKTNLISSYISRVDNNEYLSRPTGLCFIDNNFIIASRDSGDFKVYSNSFKFIKNLDFPNLTRPTSIQITKNNEMLILDRCGYKNSSIYNIDFNKANRVSKLVLKNISLNDPQDFLYNDGHIFIADTLNRRVVKYNLANDDSYILNLSHISKNKNILIRNINLCDKGILITDYDLCVIYLLDFNLKLINSINLISYKPILRYLRGTIYVKHLGYILLDKTGHLYAFRRNKLYILYRPKKSFFNLSKIFIYKNMLILADKENDRIVILKKYISYGAHKLKLFKILDNHI